MRIRVRGPSGSSTLNLEDSATVGDLRAQIKNTTSLSTYDIKYGYPPKPLYLGSDTALLSSLDSKLDGEQLTISSQYIADDVKKTSSKTTDNSYKVTSSEGPKSDSTETLKAPLSLKRKTMEAEVPEIALPDRGATLGKQTLPT
jgi:ubiquitin thioesterase OTU1